MKKFSMNLLKVGIFLILGLCAFTVGNEVSAWSTTGAINGGTKTLSEYETIEIKLPKEDGHPQALGDYKVDEEGIIKIENAGKCIANYSVGSGLAYNTEGVNHDGRYYESFKITGVKAGEVTIYIYARSIQLYNNTVKVLDQPAVYKYTIKISALPKNQTVIDNLSRPHVYFLNKASLDDMTLDYDTFYNNKEISSNRIFKGTGKKVGVKHLLEEVSTSPENAPHFILSKTDKGLKIQTTENTRVSRQSNQFEYYYIWTGKAGWVQLAVVDYRIKICDNNGGNVEKNGDRYVLKAGENKYKLIFVEYNRDGTISQQFDLGKVNHISDDYTKVAYIQNETNEKDEEYYTFDTGTGFITTKNKKGDFTLDLNYVRQYNKKDVYPESLIRLTTDFTIEGGNAETGGSSGGSGGGSGSDSNNNNNNNNNNSGGSTGERKMPTYAEDGSAVEVGHYITMKKGSAWNVYSDKECKNNVSKDNVKSGVDYEVTYVEYNRVGLNINGTTRYIIWSTDSSKAQAHFKQVTQPADASKDNKGNEEDAGDAGLVPENSSSSGLSSLNFEGILGKVFEIITKLVKFLTEKVFNPYIKPLAEELISGLTQ